MAKQLPKITSAVLGEYKQTQAIIQAEKIDGIISDNRFGTFSSRIPSVIITHQINILTPYKWLNPLARLMNQFWLKRFDSVWIPDTENKPNLSGILSHDISLKERKYIGFLSRMKKEKRANQYHLIAVLSGPEPQRTLLEEKIIQALETVDFPYLIVQGKTESFSEKEIGQKGKMISFLTSHDLNQAINESAVVLSRSGYSTIMDLAALGKKAILIPTPLQTEQEYIAQNLATQKIFVVQAQKDFHLAKALEEIPNTSGFQHSFDESQYKIVLENWLESL